MRIITLIATFIWAVIGFANAQCDLTALQVINTPGQVLFADEECTDAQGWTHYYNSASNKILLSIKKNGQDIGYIDLGMSVKDARKFLCSTRNGARDLLEDSGHDVAGMDSAETVR